MPFYPWDVGLLPDPLDAAFHWPPPAPWIINLGQLQAAKSFCFSQSVTFRPGIKIPLPPAQVRMSQDLRCTHGPSKSSATLSLWSIISWMGSPSCSHPCWLWCTINVSFHVSLPSTRLFILMLFKEEITSLKISDFKCRKIEF